VWNVDLGVADRYYEFDGDLDIQDEYWQLPGIDNAFKIGFINDAELASATFTSDTPKVASVSKKGIVTMKKTGKFKITVRIKNDNGMKFNRYISGKFIDSEAVTKVKVYKHNKDSEDKRWTSTKTIAVGDNPDNILYGKAFYTDEGDDYETTKRRVVLESSNTNVLKLTEWDLSTNKKFTGKRDDYKRAYFKVEGKKVGTATITATSKANTKKTTKVKIKVVKNQKTANSESAMKSVLSKAKDDKTIYMGVKSIELLDRDGTTNKFKVTFYVANGTKNSYGALKSKATITVDGYKDADSYFDAPVFKANILSTSIGKDLGTTWKAKKVTTFSKTVWQKNSKWVDLTDMDKFKVTVQGGGIDIEDDVLVGKGVA
jgi:hypothetical protein